MKSRLAVTTFSSVDRKQLQASWWPPWGCCWRPPWWWWSGTVFLWEDLLIPLLDTPHFKLSNGLVSWEPGGQTSVPWGRFLLRMWTTVSMKDNLIKKIKIFHQNGLIEAYALYCSSHIPCFLNFLFSLFPHPAVFFWQWLLSDSPDEGQALILPANGHQY